MPQDITAPATSASINRLILATEHVRGAEASIPMFPLFCFEVEASSHVPSYCFEAEISGMSCASGMCIPFSE